MNAARYDITGTFAGIRYTVLVACDGCGGPLPRHEIGDCVCARCKRYRTMHVDGAPSWDTVERGSYTAAVLASAGV